MKAFFTKEKNVLSEPRALLEGGNIVMAFASGDRLHFFHPGYINFQSWHFAGVLLSLKETSADGDTLLLVLQGTDDVDADSCSAEAFPQVQTMHEFVKALDLSRSWSVAYWRILNDEVVVPLQEMPPRHVSVERYSENFAVWEAVPGAGAGARARGSGAARSQGQRSRVGPPPGEARQPRQQQLLDACLSEMDELDFQQHMGEAAAEDSEEVSAEQAEQDMLDDLLAALDVADLGQQGPQGGDDHAVDVPDAVPAIPADLLAAEPVHDALEDRT